MRNASENFLSLLRIILSGCADAEWEIDLKKKNLSPCPIILSGCADARMRSSSFVFTNTKYGGLLRTTHSWMLHARLVNIF